MSRFQALQIREFRHYIIARFCFVVGMRMVGALVGWWIYELTQSKLALGLIGLAEVIPAVSLALYSGVVIDRSEKRSLLLKTLSLYCITSLMLLFISTTFFQEHFGKSAMLVGIYAVIFCTGAIRSFSGPGLGAMLGQLVPRDVLSNAAATNTAVWLAASVIGHAGAGFLIKLAGYTITFGLVFALVCIAVLMLSTLSSKPPVSNALQNSGTWNSVKEGLRFVMHEKVVLGSLTLDLFAVLFGGVVALIPVFAIDILKIGPIGFGWLNAATDIGAIIVTTTLTAYPLRKHQGRILLWVVGGFGACILVFALSKVFWLSFLALMLSGVLDGISMVIRGTIIQLRTPAELRGRVMSVNAMFINSSNELGQFESGFAASIMGTVPSVIFGGCMTLMVAVVTWLKAPELRKLQY